MTPNATKTKLSDNMLPKLVAPQADNWKFQYSYRAIAISVYLHFSALYGLLCIRSAHWTTIAFDVVLLEASILGLMAGAHRLWSHRSYKAKLPLQILLMLFQSTANQYSALNWARDHRLHHRHSDTDADPHNASRGFFFSHLGWVLVYKHPEVFRRGANTEMADLLSNPVLMFQKKYALLIIPLISFVLPSTIPMLWGETFINAYHLNHLRIILCLHFASLINSAGHTIGARPYDKEVRATENMVVQLSTLGEGFHNYHHVFPWDYRAAELKWFNLTAAFIEFFAWIGWAYDLKTVEHGMVVARARKCGDGSYRDTEDQRGLSEHCQS